MKAMNRRAIIAGATTTIAALAVPGIASAHHADAELFEALTRWQEAGLTLKDFELKDTDESETAFSEVVSAHDAIMLEAIATPAKTLEGFKAKASAIHACRFFTALGTPGFANAAGAALLADIVALHGPLPAQWVFPRT